MLAGNISSKNNLTQQDPSDLSTSQSLTTYYFRDETIHRDQMSQAFGKLEFLHKHFQFPPCSHLRWLYLESAELFCRFISSCHFQLYDSSVLFLPRAASFLLQSIICSTTHLFLHHGHPGWAFSPQLPEIPSWDHPSFQEPSQGYWAPAPLRFPSPHIAQIHSQQILLWVPCLPFL